MIFLTIFLTALCIVSVFFVVRFGLLILRIEDAIAGCLDKLDKHYNAINEILQTPLYYDSPEVRRVYQELKMSQDAILQVANVLVGQELDTYASEEEEEEN